MYCRFLVSRTIVLLCALRGVGCSRWIVVGCAKITLSGVIKVEIMVSDRSPCRSCVNLKCSNVEEHVTLCPPRFVSPRSRWMGR